MSLLRTFKLAWEGLALNKGRSFLTTLGVIIGVAAVIMMLAVSAGAEAQIADQINTLGTNLIMVSPVFTRGGFSAQSRSSEVSLTYDDIQAISQNVTGINGVSADQQTGQKVQAGTTTLTDVEIVGTTAGFPQVRELTVAMGRFLSDEDNLRVKKVAVLGASAATQLFGQQSPLGQKITIGTYRFTVVGVMQAKGALGNTNFDAQIYIPLTVVFKNLMPSRFGGTNIRMLYVSATDRGQLDTVITQVIKLLNKRHSVDPSTTAFQTMTQDSIIAAASSTTESFRNLLAWVAAVSLLVGGIGIMNIMLVSVTERTREIGLRQAMGARPGDVQLQFLLEAVTLSLLGGLIGVLVGVGGSYLFGALGSMRTQLVPASIPLAFGAAAAVGIFFGYYPATKAAQLDPIEALRRE
jgi:putative ABC transport system permease protein